MNRFSTFLLLAATMATTAIAGDPPVDPARVEQIAKMLPDAPTGVGRPITDRAPWQRLAKLPAFKDAVADAEAVLKEPIPELPDDLYLDFSRTGNRTRYQRVMGERHARVPRLVLAECLENKGRFTENIETSIRAVCEEKTWVYPAHDRSLANFKGTTIEIDLGTVYVSWTLATADYWLGDKLSPAVRQLIREQLQRRVFGPMESYMASGKPRLWWATGTNNWNAVCVAGVTGSALAVIDDRRKRAFFVAAAEHYIQNFLRGFTADGYCSEGIGYWNYGFGNYVMLAETLHQATDGKIDWLAEPKIKQIALFGRRMEITPGIFPAFADCHLGSRPGAELMAFLSRRFSLGLEEIERSGLLAGGGSRKALFGVGLLAFENSASRTPPAPQSATAQPPRDWFAEAGILICRPAGDNPRGLAVALKGGHNAEHHNHNDVGSFIVALGGQTPLLDPGSEIYTARTFSGQRYVSGVLNSLGHPVPRVAGKLQRSGRSAAAVILKTEFTDQTDTIVLDLRAAYAIEGLEKLQRTFVFSRRGAGSLTVIDEVRLATPASFGTALVTLSPWSRSGDGRLLVGDSGSAVQVDIAAEGGKLAIDSEEIREDLPHGHIPERLGIDFTEPVTEATITLTITPTGADSE